MRSRQLLDYLFRITVASDNPSSFGVVESATGPRKMQVSKIDEAIRRFNAENARDPNSIVIDGTPHPRELVQAERLAAWVHRLNPAPSDALRLAAHCQHLRRWEIPRASFPEGRVGYLKWRKALSRFHADTAAELMRELGIDEGTIAAVRRINLKQGLPNDSDTQTIEDALCLAFLEYELAEFASKHDSAKVSEILRKTWRKMSPGAQATARQLPLPPAVETLVRAALADSSSPSDAQ